MAVATCGSLRSARAGTAGAELRSDFISGSWVRPWARLGCVSRRAAPSVQPGMSEPCCRVGGFGVPGRFAEVGRCPGPRWWSRDVQAIAPGAVVCWIRECSMVVRFCLVCLGFPSPCPLWAGSPLLFPFALPSLGGFPFYRALGGPVFLCLALATSSLAL